MKREGENSFHVYLYGYAGHVLPTLVFKFNDDGKLIKTSIEIPRFTLALIAIAFSWTTFLMVSNSNGFRAWPILIFPMTLTVIILAGGVAMTKRKLKQMERLVEKEKTTFDNKS